MEKIYKKFNDKNIAPYLSDHIVVKNENGENVGTIELSDFKPNYGRRLYRFAVMSDIHFYEDFPNDYNGESNALDDFRRAINFINTKPENDIDNIEFSCVCGDIMYNSGDDLNAINNFKEIRNNSDKPIYTCTGNHDTSKNYDWEDSNYITNKNRWEDCVGTSRTHNFFHTFTTSDNNIKQDNFYFLSMRKFSLGTQGKMFKDEDIEELENFLELHKNERTFIFTHCPFPYRSGLFSHTYNNGDYWLGGKWLKRLSDLSYKYKNTIWFSGHSHYQWDCQGYYSKYITDDGYGNVYNFKEYNYDANIWPVNQDHDRECGWALHIPSCAGIRTIKSSVNSKLDSEEEFKTMNFYNYNTYRYKPSSEFAIIDVYENYIDFRGVSLIGQDENNEGTLQYNPIAQYRLDTTILPENTESYSLLKLSRTDLNNMNIGEYKNICITSVAYNNFHLGSIENEYKNAAIHTSFGTTKIGTDVNCDLSSDNTSDKFIYQQNNEYQLFAEMRDLVNMRPKQFCFRINKDTNGYYITNSYGYNLNLVDGKQVWQKDNKTYFNIIPNNYPGYVSKDGYIASSCLVSQINNDYLIRIVSNYYLLYFPRTQQPTTLQLSEDSGWTLLYIYEVIRT